MTDPRRIAAAIGEVVDDLQRWQNAAQMAVEEANVQQLRTTEEVTSADRLAALAVHHALERADDVARIRGSAHEAADAGALAVAAADYRTRSAANTDRFAGAVVAGWERELAAAQGWRSRAQERVRRAEAWVQRARAEVTAAAYALRRAQGALNACRRDRERRNCNGEAAAVSHAETALFVARQDLQNAEHELQLAHEELAHAERRVSGCGHALGLAHQAASLASNAMAEAREAAHMGMLARDHGNDAVARAGRAEEANARQRAAAEQSVHSCERATAALADASKALMRSETAYQSARRLAFDGSSEMRTAIRQLRDFDRGALA